MRGQNYVKCGNDFRIGKFFLEMCILVCEAADCYSNQLEGYEIKDAGKRSRITSYLQRNRHNRSRDIRHWRTIFCFCDPTYRIVTDATALVELVY